MLISGASKHISCVIPDFFYLKILKIFCWIFQSLKWKSKISESLKISRIKGVYEITLRWSVMDSSFPNVRAFRVIKSTPEAPSLIITFIKLNSSLYKNLIVNIRYTLKSGLSEPNIKFIFVLWKNFKPQKNFTSASSVCRFPKSASELGPKLTMDPIGQDMSAHFWWTERLTQKYY